MSIIQGNAHQGSTRGFYPKTIEGSLRFNDDDSAYLSWTPASAGNRKTWTLSFWLKRCTSGVGQAILQVETTNGSVYTGVTIENDKVFVDSYGGTGALQARAYTNAVLRDPSAWYHIVAVLNTPASTATDRAVVYINGVNQSMTFADGFDQNADLLINTTNEHRIGAHVLGNEGYLDGYLAEVHFTDGTAYTADDFGELKNGVWVAKTPSVTYGTNGFYLNFQDDTAVEAFNTVLWNGYNQDISVTGCGFSPDLVWAKSRGAGTNHFMFDTVRGAGKMLHSNATTAEITNSPYGYLSSFDSDGMTFEVGSSDGTYGTYSGHNYVAWCWKAGDSNVSNTDGSITSTVRANQTYGFSIVSYQGQTTADTVGHGLTQAPDWIVVKNRDTGNEWAHYHSALGADTFMYFTTAAATSGNTSVWNNTAPTSSVFSIGTSDATSGQSSGDNMIAYCFHSVEGFSKFGSYTGGTNPKTITTGFKPALVIIKRTDGGTDHWFMFDNTRTVDQSSNAARLLASSTAAEGVGSSYINFTDTGFTMPQTHESTNGSGMTYIYAAFADTREAAFWLDQSGNDNDWQPVNLDHNDTVADSPTNNYATLNPFNGGYNPTGTLSDGNLRVTTNNAGTETYGTMAIPSSGQYYWEATVEVSNNAYLGIGLLRYSSSLTRYRYLNDGQKDVNGTTSAYGASFAAGDVIGVAVDADAGTIEFYKNGTGQGSFSIDLSLGDFFPLFMDGNSGASSTFVVNFGQQPFKYDPPA